MVSSIVPNILSLRSTLPQDFGFCRALSNRLLYRLKSHPLALGRVRSKNWIVHLNWGLAP